MMDAVLKKRLRRLTVGVTAMVTALLAATGGVLYYLYGSMQTSSRQWLQAETQEYKNRILKQLEYDVQCLRTASAMLRREDVEDRSRMVDILLEANESNSFLNMVLFYPDGTGVTARSETGARIDLSLDACHAFTVEAVERALSGQDAVSKLFYSDYFYNGEDGRLCVFSVPVYVDGQVVGALTAGDRIDIFEDILSGDTVLGGQGYIHLINPKGELLVRSPYSVVQEDVTSLFDGGILAQADAARVQAALEDSESVFSQFSYGGGTYQFYIEPVGINGWNLYCTDTNNSTADYMDHVLMVVSVALLLLAGMAVAILSVAFRSFRRSSEALHKLAYYDPLTGAENTALFKSRLEARRLSHATYSIAAMNIRRFKFINEFHGAAAGDQILRDVKDVLSGQLRPGEFFCRDAADLFYLMLEDTDEAVIRMRLERLMTEVRERCAARCGGNVALYCGVSVGGDRARALLAMQAIRGSVQTSISFYDAQIHEEERRKSQIEHQMDQALEQEEFQLFLQPKVSLETGELAGAEALVRWRKPDGTYRFPGEFIPLFEENGFCTKLDLYMVEQVCRQLRRWIDEGYRPVPVSVNQTRLLFFSPGYVEQLCTVVERWGIQPELLTLEILEGVALGDPETLNGVIDQLHERGFRVSMDDFGSGYSSLNALYQLHIDELKLDRGFLAAAEREDDRRRRRAILEQIIQFAATMGLSTVAEGVETAEDEALLRELHCQLGQGYYYSRPIDAETFTKKFFDLR